jgi:RND family efflux transporter MFP subunit
VKSGDIGQTLSANGTLHAIQQSMVRAKVAGEIVAVDVREGERVNAGQVLARIDDSEYAARVKDRRAALEAGRAQSTFAESTRSKNAELLQKKFISSQAYDNAKSAASVASSQMQSLEAQLSLAEKALNDTVVRAPISGWLAERAVQRGDKASVDGKLFTIVDLSRLELEALVPANEVARVAVGQVFTTSVEGFAGKRFTGHVARIGAQAASGSRSITIYIEIANPDAALKAGLFAQGTLSLGRSPARALVPITALHSESGVNYVYAIDSNRIKRLPVEVGAQSEADGVADILKGLEAGMRVVAVNLGPLKDGANVTINAAKAR